jgi:enoyl-CoA hydratase/carnithine racemase
VVAAVHGYGLGGAFELTLPCDFTIGTAGCRLGEPEILFGAAPAFLMVPWMTGHKRAKDVLLTGRHLGAAEALDMGLVTRGGVGRRFLERQGMRHPIDMKELVICSYRIFA